MPRKKRKDPATIVGVWSIVLATILSIILGLITLKVWMAYIIIFIGFLAGILNIISKKTRETLIVGVALAIVAYMTFDVTYGLPGLERASQAILLMLFPALVIISLREALRVIYD